MKEGKTKNKGEQAIREYLEWWNFAGIGKRGISWHQDPSRLNEGKGLEDDDDTNGSFLPHPAELREKSGKMMILTVVIYPTLLIARKGREDDGD